MQSGVRFAKQGEVVVRRIAGESILVPVAHDVGDLDAVYTMGEVGDFIWQRVDGWTSFGEIVDALCEAFDVARDQAEADTGEFLASLLEAGLIAPIENEGQG